MAQKRLSDFERRNRTLSYIDSGVLLRVPARKHLVFKELRSDVRDL